MINVKYNTLCNIRICTKTKYHPNQINDYFVNINIIETYIVMIYRARSGVVIQRKKMLSYLLHTFFTIHFI